MKWKSETTVEKTYLASRRIFGTSMLLIILAGSIAALIAFTDWKWLDPIFSILIISGVLLLIVSWVAPGVLIALGAPRLVHAWLQGMNPLAIRNKTWEDSSDIEKVLIYFWAILLSSSMLLFLVLSFQNSLK
jgi:hypothetical protein